ncbi:MAG: type II secretion system protein GspC [Gammaproteobacteria bacterium]|jgi:general secretion pathway protein C
MKEWGENFIQRFWVDGLDKRLPVIATLIGIVLIANSFAALTWKLVPVPDVPASAVSANKNIRVASNQSTSAAAEQRLAAKISQFHLFGKFEKKKLPPPVAEVAAAPETRLNLKLRGVFSSQDKDIARAIIADAKGEDESYAIGDEVPGGATLNDIFEDRVILERNGQLETLKLPVESLPGDTATAISRGIPSSRRDVGRAPPQPIDTATADTSQILRHYRDALINDPQSVMGLVRVQPYNKGGRLEGYRIRPGKDRRLLTKFGLRSGDIVKAVNGVPMDNPIKALEILRDLSTATSVTVDIERNGTPRSFTFQIQ